MNRSHTIKSDILSPAAIGELERGAFIRWAKDHEHQSAEALPYFSEEDAIKFIEGISPNLDTHYSWFKQSDPIDVARLLNEIQSIREDYIKATGNRPTDADIYRRYRLKLLSAESQSGSFGHKALVDLDAAMNGNVANDTYLLP